MKIEKRNKFPIINSYPWRCNGIEDHWHPEIENYDQSCNFPTCQQKCFQIPYRSKKFALTSVGLIACAFLIPIMLDALTPYPGQTRFQYGGSTAFAPIRNQKSEKTIEKNLSKTLEIPKLDLTYFQNPLDTPGTSSGIKMLIEGQLSFAHASRPLRTKEIKEAGDRGLTIKQTDVAIDGIAIFVNPDLNISQLTVEQVRDLFTGKIRNWREVGGSSIGYASASVVCNQEKVQAIALSNNGDNFINPCIDKKVNTSAFDGSYPLTRNLFVITKQDNADDQKVGEGYIKMLQSNKGQELLKQAGFAPIFGDIKMLQSNKGQELLKQAGFAPIFGDK